MTIAGVSANTTIIDGGGINTVVTIPNANTRVGLSNLTIRNGTAKSGGGINNSWTLTAKNCVISGNKAAGKPGRGGGIYNTGALTINSSTLNGKTASGRSCLFNCLEAAGAGIDNERTLSVNNSTLSRNGAQSQRRAAVSLTLGQRQSTAYLLGGRQALGQWLIQMPSSVFVTIEFFFLLLGLKIILRKDWLAALGFIAIFVGMQALQTSHLALVVPLFVVVYAVAAVLVIRFGLVPLAIAAFTVDMLENVPFTADFSQWYMPTTVLALVGVLAIAGWGSTIPWADSRSGKQKW